MKFNPYSILKLGCYYACPKQFNFKSIQKIKVPFKYNVALYKGNFIHSIIENDYNYNIEFNINEIFTQEEKDKAIEITKNFESSELGQLYKKVSTIPELNPKFEEKFGYVPEIFSYPFV